MEEWKFILGTTRYKVSNMGRIRSYANTSRTRGDDKNPHLLKPYKRSRGYSVDLTINGQIKRYQISRLVATAFIPNPERLPIVAHIDGDSFNNEVSNLKWSAHDEVQKLPPVKEKHDLRLKKKQIRCINTGKIYPSLSQAAKEVGCSRGNICNVLKGRIPNTKGLYWEYVS